MELIEIKSGGGVFFLALRSALPPEQSGATVDWGDGSKSSVRLHCRSSEKISDSCWILTLRHTYPAGDFLLTVSGAELAKPGSGTQKPDEPDEPDNPSAFLGEIRDSLVGSHSVELGFDNEPAKTDDGADRAFRCFVAGSNNSYGDSVCIFGDSNSNRLGFVQVWGNSNKTYQSQTVFGDMNEFTASVRVFAAGSRNSDSGTNAGNSFVFGDMNTIGNKNGWTAGYRISNRAKGAAAFGRAFTLEDKPENEYSFALGDSAVSFVHRVYRAIENPLYDPAKDPAGTGTDSSGERRTMPVRAYSTEYRGHLTPAGMTLAPGAAPLDHDLCARWDLAGSGVFEPSAENWRDGDTGEISADTATQEIRWPAEWIIPPEVQKILDEPGPCWFQLRREHGKIIIAGALAFGSDQNGTTNSKE